MKRYLTTFLFALMACMTTLAQAPREGGNRPSFNPEEFQTKMDSYIRDKADLSQEDADKVFPIYHEMKQKQKELNEQMRKLKRPSKDATDYAKVIAQINEINVKLAKLEQTYYAKMCKTIDSRKVFDIMRAEDAFHREMLSRIGKRPGQMDRPGQGARRPGQDGGRMVPRRDKGPKNDKK